MKFYTTLYPVFMNKNLDGSFEYGFLTGEQLKPGTLFNESNVLCHKFQSKQDFKFLEPVKTQIITPNEGYNERRGNITKRLFSAKGEKILKIVGSDLDSINFTEVDTDNE